MILVTNEIQSEFEHLDIPVRPRWLCNGCGRCFADPKERTLLRATDGVMPDLGRGGFVITKSVGDILALEQVQGFVCSDCSYATTGHVLDIGTRRWICENCDGEYTSPVDGVECCEDMDDLSDEQRNFISAHDPEHNSEVIGQQTMPDAPPVQLVQAEPLRQSPAMPNVPTGALDT